MANESDGDHYDDIDIDSKGKPVLFHSPERRPPFPPPRELRGSPVLPSLKSPSLKSKLPQIPPVVMKKKTPPAPPKRTHTLNSFDRYPSATLPSRVSRSNSINNGSVPARPPKPPPTISNTQFDDLLNPHKRKVAMIHDYIQDSEELSTEKFVSKYQDKFPLRVRVCKGFYGHSERTSVSEGDSFHIHFIKHTQVVHMMDGSDAVYKIALNSSLEFGPMYNPNKKRDEALIGFTFEKVAEIISLKDLPKVLKVGVAWSGSNSSTSLDRNELLVVKSVKKRLGSKYLKVFSITKKTKKVLPENCVGKFSTKPSDVRFFLADIVKHIPEPLPVSAVLFVHAETASEIPSHLISAVVNLTCTSIETSLIATNTDVENFVDAPMMDIPLDLDIEFQVLHYKHTKDTEQLYSDTRTLLEHFNPSNVASYITKPDDNSNQSAIKGLVRKDLPLSGVDIVKPSAIYCNVQELLASEKKRLSSSSSNQSGSKTDIDPIYEMEPDEFGFNEPPPNITNQGYEQRFKAVEETLTKFKDFEATSTQVSHQLTSSRADMIRLQGRATKASEDVSGLNTQVLELRSTVDQLRRALNTLQTQMNTILGQGQRQGMVEASPIDVVNGTDDTYSVIPLIPNKRIPNQEENSTDTASSVSSSVASIPEDICEQNRIYLGSLNYLKILRLLELMGLKAHQEIFMAERIDGEMLLECDDEVLQDELQVKSKLRRVRLLKLISGRRSAEQILNGEDPYVYAAT